MTRKKVCTAKFRFISISNFPIRTHRNKQMCSGAAKHHDRAAVHARTNTIGISSQKEPALDMHAINHAPSLRPHAAGELAQHEPSTASLASDQAAHSLWRQYDPPSGEPPP